MYKHEKKYCPRCQGKFECKVGDIIRCQCNKVELTPLESNYIQKLYFDDCLCAQCIEELKENSSLT